MKEEQILVARIKDLAKRCYQQNIYTYSQFLSPGELSVLDHMQEELSFVDYTTFGGNEMCERQMIGFGSKEMLGYEGNFPIQIVCVEHLIEKFADALSHRDYLGAVMNLGLDRGVVGDILVKEKKAYIFCQESMADYILEGLKKIKHTHVKCTIVSQEIEALAPKFQDVECLVAAPRFDGVIAALLKCSRNEAIALFQGRRVFLNGRVSERNSMTLKDGDVFSVRGFGKYIFCGCSRETKKGKIYVHIKQYM